MLRIVSVIGAGSTEQDTDVAGQAYEVGRLLGAAGVTLVCGGLGGVMEQACRGARESGGQTIGILPGVARESANPYVDIALPTGLGEARNIICALAGRAVIAIGGAWGTLTEIAFARKHGAVVIGLTTWPDLPGVEYVATPREAVERALQIV